MRVLVVTVVHHPGDARIFAREIRALLEAGHEVTYAAPFSAYGVPAPGDVRALDLPRAVGRTRLRALRAARALVRREAAGADVVLLHDPELLLAVAGLRTPPVVWDVHEDTAAAVSLKPWLPPRVRPAAAAVFRAVERVAERRVHLLLAEAAYQERFRRQHPFVPNTTPVPDRVPPPDEPRVVYVGHNSRARGAFEIIGLARELRGEVGVEVIGHADDEAGVALRAAVDEGLLTWHGFLPNAEALRRAEGATAGLALLHDEPNYRHSFITKIVEYMAHGLPIITTPLPLPADAVQRYGTGLVVPFEDVPAVAAAVRRLRADDGLRRGMGERGHAVARAEFSWDAGARTFVDALARWAGTASAVPSASPTSPSSTGSTSSPADTPHTK